MITGGSSGIGFEAAREYIRRGANVTIVARNMEKLNEAVSELEKMSTSGSVLAVSIDTSSSYDTVEEALRPALCKYGDVSVLVNCAGVSVAGEFDQLDINEFNRMLRVNVLGSVYPTRVVLGGMKRRRSGRIVFVSSQVAQVAIHGYTAYAASKWALRGLAEALQMEVKPFGIFVSVCYPPDTATPGYEVEMKDKPLLTKQLSESGSVFAAESVALDLVNMSSKGYFGISTGFDGWLLKQLHPGMSPVNNLWETVQPILLSSFARIIAVFYVMSWDKMVAAYVKNSDKAVKSKKTD